ncbi:hypothetical protein BaRGS_00030415, partial [Batillaria attramentaria]
TVVPEDTPMAVIVGGVVGGILVLATVAAVVGVLIWKKRNPRYEKPLPRRERESDAYTGLQPTNNDTGRQPPAGIANPQNSTGHGELDHPHSYMEVLPPDNTYDPLQMTRRQDTAVYTDLRPTGPGGRGTDRAVVNNFTINDTSGSLAVNERDNVTVIFTCNARGRPAPNVTLHKANGELPNEVGNTPSDEHKTVSSTLVGVTSEDMGTYTCTADNNFTSPKQEKVQLNVRTAPTGNSTTTKENPQVMTKEGLSFTVIAFPEPDIFHFTFYGNKLNPALSSVPSGTFNVTSIVEDPSLPVVICSIKPLDVPYDRLGVYRVEVSNGLEGTYKYFFEVNETDTVTVVPEDTPTAFIVGGAVAGILVLATVAVVVGVLIRKKRNPRYEKPLPRRERESDAYTGLQPTNNDTGGQPPAGIANPQHPTGLTESDRPHSYMEVLPPDNKCDPLHVSRRQDTAVYTELHPTGPGGRGTDKATVKSFTINGTSGSLAVNEWDNATVIFTCNARGRPAPSVTLHKVNGELLNEIGNTPSDQYDKTVSYTILRVTSEDMRRYICTADNSFTTPNEDNFQLNVRIAPRAMNFTTTKENPELLAKMGLSFTVVAFPKPEMFTFTFYGNKSLSSVPSGTFKVTSIVEDPSLPVVICSIKPLDVPHDRLATVPSGDSPVAAIVGGVVGGILVLTVAVVVGVLIWKKRNPRYERPLPRREGESDHYTDLTPPSNASNQQSTNGISNSVPPTDYSDATYQSPSYVNMSTSPRENTYDPLQMSDGPSTD